MWIVRRTSTQLIIWRTLGLSESYLKALRAIFMIAIFVLLTGQFRAINCSRQEAHGPLDCEVTTGTIFGTTTQSLKNVHDVFTKYSSKSYVAVLVHADGETSVGSFNSGKVVSLVASLLHEKTTRAAILVDDMR